MTRDEIAQDLSYVRALAEEGRNAPLVGGSIVVYFGVILAVAYGLQWAFITHQFGSPQGIWFAALWTGFGIASAIGVFLLRRRARQLPGAASSANRVDGIVWSGVGIAFFPVVLGSVARSVVSQDPTAPNVIMAFGFAAYGVVLRTTSILSQTSWLRAFALLSYAWSAALWFYMNEPWAYLLASAGCVTVLIVPGVIMMGREPKAIA